MRHVRLSKDEIRQVVNTLEPRGASAFDTRPGYYCLIDNRRYVTNEVEKLLNLKSYYLDLN